jgi:demethylmenaquinone methyltransferase/2-methoxy-6-polyprenyl-1,4-benzoquinol methylase
MDETGLLDSQRAYYRARAAEYDEWFLRQGRYDRGPELRERWLREVEQIAAALSPVVQGAEVLELACGTGWWTQRLAALSRSVVAVDASPEVIALNRKRVKAGNVEYQLDDVFDWAPKTRFDVVFFSFWLSHVPPARFDAFWELVRRALKPDGRAFFIDSLLEDRAFLEDRPTTVRRTLNDGREFDIVKVFYEPAELELRLNEQGWSGWVRSTETFFLYGCITPTPAPG